MRPRTPRAVLGGQAAHLSRQNVCDAEPARAGQEQRQVAPAPMGAQWHGHRPPVSSWLGRLRFGLQLKLGMPGADKNTTLTMQNL